MYISFVYDHKFIKHDRDFYGDAIVSFFPSDYKERYLYLIGQLIGSIDFFKGFFLNSKLNQFKMDNMLFVCKQFSAQYSLIIATDQINLANELILKKKLLLLFNLIQLVYGQIIDIDRSDELNYKQFKERINEIVLVCSSLVFKSKRVTFNSYFSCVSASLQLLDKCVPFNEKLTLPFRCYLVKVNVSNKLFNALIRESNTINISSSLSNRSFSFNESTSNLNENQLPITDSDNESGDLTMDILPESYRFTSAVSIRSASNILDDLVNFNENDYEDDEDDNELSEENNYGNTLTMYVQTNSRLKIVLLSLHSSEDQYQKDNTIRVWQNIVSNFSEIEFEFMNEEHRIEKQATTLDTTSQDINLNQQQQSQQNESHYTCVIDRNRMIKFSSNTKNQLANKKSLNLTPAISSNMNVFYELLQSMPEISQLQISKKGHRYSFFKQNVAHLASTSLQQQNESNNEQQTRLKNSTTTTPATSRNRIEYELVDKPNLTKTISPSILSTVSSQSTLANNLQYEPAFTNIFKMQNTSNNNSNILNTASASTAPNLRSKPIPTGSRMTKHPNKFTNTNRYTIAIPGQENVEQLYHHLKLETLNSDSSNSFKQDDHTHPNSSPLSKTPDSSGDIGNWIDVPDSGLGSSGLGAGDSVGTIGDSDDHDMIESVNHSINHDEIDSADEEYKYKSSLNINSNNTDELNNKNNLKQSEDYTTKRLKTFVATTLDNEKIYLNKLARLLKFKNYLEENYAGSPNELNVLFSDIVQIYKIHDVVAIKLQDYLNSFSDLQKRDTSSGAKSSYYDNNALIKETFLSSALQLLANIMEISFPVYLEYLTNYPRSLSILNKLEKQTASAGFFSSKRKSFIDCQSDFNNKILNMNKKALQNTSPTKHPKQVKDEFNLYAPDTKKLDEKIDTAKLFSEEILLRPTILFMLINSLKDECMLAANDLPANSSNILKANIKSMFDNETSRKLRDKVFEQIKLNRMPKEARKHEDVVELCERNNERKLRHLILYGDCLVCCRIKKEKRQLKWVIPIDKLEIFLDDYKSAKSEIELRHLREEVVSLRGDLKKEENTSSRNQLKIKKKLAEHENELTLQSSRLKLIVRSNPTPTTVLTSVYTSSSGSSNTASTNKQIQQRTNLGNSSLASSMNNLTVSTTSNSSYLTPRQAHFLTLHSNSSNIQIASSSQFNSNSNVEQYVFLFTSDFERIAWLDEINGAIYAFNRRNVVVNISNSDIESRITSLRKIEEPPKVITSSCTGSLELLIKHIDELQQPNRVFVAVELKSCGSYLQVAQTKCTDLTTKPIWNEKFTLELQCVDSLRIIYYCQTTGKALAISSQELKIDSNVNLNKINCVKLNNGVIIQLAMKFLSPKKTITRRRTRNRNDLFGANLAELLQREKTTIPRILKDCVEVIETKGIEEVGIYRVSSVVSEVQKMKDLYSKNPNIALGELRQKSPHLSANVLKLYLRELPEPLFTTHLYHRFMSALECSVPEFISVELCRIFSELPDVNKTIILFILSHLLNIASKSDKNMMGLQNLCTLFGPTLMKLSPKDNLQVDDMAKEIKESMQQAQVLFYILKLHEEDRLIVDPEQKEQLNQLSNSSSSSSIVHQQNMIQMNPNATTTTLSTIVNLDKNNNNLNKLNLQQQQQQQSSQSDISNYKDGLFKQNNRNLIAHPSTNTAL